MVIKAEVKTKSKQEWKSNHRRELVKVKGSMGSSSHFLAELEEQEMLNFMKGKIPEPSSNAPATTKNKYTKGEVKAKKIIIDSIGKRLVAYISDLNTSKEIYDRLLSMFKVSDANQILFLKK